MQYLKFYKGFGTTIVKDKLYPIVEHHIDGDDELLYFLPQDEVKTIVHKSREGELFEIIEKDEEELNALY
jgi:hypothetical protein